MKMKSGLRKVIKRVCSPPKTSQNEYSIVSASLILLK